MTADEWCPGTLGRRTGAWTHRCPGTMSAGVVSAVRKEEPLPAPWLVAPAAVLVTEILRLVDRSAHVSPIISVVFAWAMSGSVWRLPVGPWVDMGAFALLTMAAVGMGQAEEGNK